MATHLLKKNQGQFKNISKISRGFQKVFQITYFFRIPQTIFTVPLRFYKKQDCPKRISSDKTFRNEQNLALYVILHREI